MICCIFSTSLTSTQMLIGTNSIPHILKNCNFSKKRFNQNVVISLCVYFSVKKNFSPFDEIILIFLVLDMKSLFLFLLMKWVIWIHSPIIKIDLNGYDSRICYCPRIEVNGCHIGTWCVVFHNYELVSLF